MTITKRLLFTLSVALFGMLLVGGYGIWQLDQAQSRFNYVEINTFPSLKDMTDAQHALTTIRVNSLRVLVALNQDQRDESLAAIADADKQFDATLADYLANDISNDADRQLLEADKAAMADYRSVRDKSMDLAKAGSHDQAVALFMSDGLKAAKVITKALDNHYKFNTDLADDLSRQNNSQFSWSMILLSSLIAGVFLVTGLQRAHLFHIIRNGLAGISLTLNKVRQSRDFTLRAPVERKDEIGQTANSFNCLLEDLQQSMRNLHGGAQQVASASMELSQTANQVSAASSAQSEAASNMAATVEQMTVSVNHVADQAKETYAGQLKLENWLIRVLPLLSRPLLTSMKSLPWSKLLRRASTNWKRILHRSVR